MDFNDQIAETLRRHAQRVRQFNDAADKFRVLASEIHESLNSEGLRENALPARSSRSSQRKGEVGIEPASEPAVPESLRNSIDAFAELARQIQEQHALLASADDELASSHDLLQDLMRQAYVDPLTALPNRRALDVALSEQLAVSPESDVSCTIALIDVDQFKQINFAYGHAAGDQVLERLGILLPGLLGESTVIARYGGDEFAVLIKRSLSQSVTLLERARQSLETEDWSRIESVAGDRTGAGTALRCQVSIGVSEIKAGTPRSDVFAKADDALYQAKSKGRNRTFYHDGATVVAAG